MAEEDVFAAYLKRIREGTKPTYEDYSYLIRVTENCIWKEGNLRGSSLGSDFHGMPFGAVQIIWFFASKKHCDAINGDILARITGEDSIYI